MGKSFRKEIVRTIRRKVWTCCRNAREEIIFRNILRNSPEGVDVLQKCQAIRKGSFLPEGVGAVGSYEVLPADRQEVPGRGYQGREYGDSRRRF